MNHTSHSLYRVKTLQISAAVLLTMIVTLAVIGSLAHAAEADKPDASAAKELRIGYQKYGTLIILKARGTLEKRLAAQGVAVKWTEFPAGPQLLEGLNVGSIDFGTVGEAPPIFAQAAGADIVYVGNEPPSPHSEGIVVPADSPIHSLAELKGKRVALNKGSNVHYLLVKLIEKAGLKYSDITPVFLAPADARAAFERGSVDAWAIWDPFFAASEVQVHARLLADGEGAVSNRQFYLASRDYAAKYPAVIKAVSQELDAVDTWGKKNPDEVAKFLATETGLDIPTLQVAAGRYAYGVSAVSSSVITDQQHIADTFFDLKLIPHPIKVADATLLAKP
jgi:sulfonate transport system substrate-binding protein